MNRLTRIALCLLLSISLFIPTLALTAAQAESGEKVKLTYWHMGDTEMSDFARETFEKQLGSLLDEIELEIVNIPANQYENKLRIACNTGNPPDVFMVDGVYTANYAASGILAPLDEFWPKEDFEDYVQTSQDKCMYDGSIYAVSQQESSCVLFYNKDLFEAAGITDIATSVENAWTYDRLVEVARELTVKDDSGAVVQYGLLPAMASPDSLNEGHTFVYLNWIWNHGGEVTAPDMSVASGYIDSEKTIAAVQAYADLFQEYQCSPLQAVEQGFQTGKIAMQIHNASLIGGYRANFPDLNFGVMPLPRGEFQYGTSGGWNYGMSSQCENKEAAWKFLYALTGKEGHVVHCEANRAMPSRLSTIEALDFLRTEPEMIIASDLIKIGRARPITPAYNEISPYIAEMVNAAAFGADPAAAAQDAAKRMDKILAKYQ